MLSKNTTINIFSHVYLPQTGGIERYTSNFANELSELGYLVNIITTNSHNLETVDEENNVVIYRLKAANLINGRFPLPYSLNQVFRVYKYFFRNQKSLVILNSRLFLTSVIGLLLGKLSGSKVILIEHGSAHLKYSNQVTTKIFEIYEHLITYIFKYANIEFYGVSEAANEWLKHFGIASSGVIYNGVNTRVKISSQTIEKFELPKSKKIITYIGRMIEEKGVIELIEAFKKFNKQKNEYHLCLVGEGELSGLVKELAQNSFNISYLGRLDHSEVLGLLSKTSLFVNPSNYGEGLPTTLLEAGLFNVPVISTPNGGSKEIIADKETGKLIPAGRKLVLLRALREFDKNKRSYSYMGKKYGQKIKNEFSWSRIAKEFVESFAPFTKFSI